MRYPSLLAALCLVALLVARTHAQDVDPFTGPFTGDALLMDLRASGQEYSGTITFQGKSYPARATRSGNTLSGTFVSDGNEFPFTATSDGNRLTFVTGRKTILLTRQSDAAPAGNPPAGYGVVNSTDYGQALATQKAGATSIQAALAATLPDLRGYFDAAPKVLTAYEDTRDRTIGGATFAALRAGKDVKGWISCKIYPQGAVVAVVYCRADAPAAEWNKLLKAPASQGGATQVQLREYRFPDGTGSIGLAEGWTTDAPSCMQMVTIKGPNQQELVLGFYLSVNTPDSQAVQIQNQLIENARMMGAPPPQLPPMFVAPFTPPAQAMANLIPQVNQMGMRTTGVQIAIDNLKELQQVQPHLLGAQAAVLSYGLTIASPQAGQKHYKVLDRVECTPVGAGAWMYSSHSARAPDATFDQDLPVMLAIAGSLKENPQVIQQKTNENIDAANRRFQAQQQAHRELVATYESYNRSWERNQTIQSRSMDNYSEAMRGYRTVEDTTTRERTSVDLGHVDQIVDRLNEHDPGRYRQIPLRDDLHPLPGNR